MTDHLNYSSDVPKSRQHNRESERETAYLPPDYASLRKQPVEDDGKVKYRPTDLIASRRLKSILVERALETEAINAPIVAALNIGGRPDRLIAPLSAIYKTVLEYFQPTGISLTELRDTNRRTGIISHVRGIVFEIALRHTRLSSHGFAAKFGCDHSSVSFVRTRIRNMLAYNDIEARALRADLNAVTVALANKFCWKSGRRPFDSRAALAQQLCEHIKTINLVSSNGFHPRICLSRDWAKISEDIADACKILMQEESL